MYKKITQAFILAALSTLICGNSLFAQQVASPEPAALSPDFDQTDILNAPDVIFSNLDRTRGARYNKDRGFILAGRMVGDQTELWAAFAFTPREDVMAKALGAAVTYVSGDRLVVLGIYTDDDGSVGELLPGGEASTAQIPDSGECCQLAKVILPGEGVALTAGTHYWLVAHPDNVNGPTFRGEWNLSNLARSAYLQPPFPWNPQPGAWLAALIRGTKVATKAAKFPGPSHAKAIAPDGNVTIFKNLGPDPAAGGFFDGVQVSGNKAPFTVEGWEALPFTPRANVHAKTLGAAIGYISGTKSVRLGIYADNGGTVGTVLPGGQGSTSEIPNVGDCCELATVTLPGEGVALTAGTQYWLVASPDNVNAPDFLGRWQSSNLAFSAFLEPEHFLNWTYNDGRWLAADIRGTLP